MSPHSQTGRQWIESGRIFDRLAYDHDGKFVGKIRRLLIHRHSGHVEEVVVHTHGHSEFGALDLALPWSTFRNDTRLQDIASSAGKRIGCLRRGCALSRRRKKHDQLCKSAATNGDAMKRFLLVLVTPLVALPWTMTTGSAQSYSLDAEAVCSEQPRHPACLAIFWQYCAQNPDEAVCWSDDDADEGSSQ
jgi:hypothetical protein